MSARQQIENLPQSDRNFLNFAALAPGVTCHAEAPTVPAVQAGAVSSLDNTNVFIDGLSLKNPVNHGGVAGQNFVTGNPFPQLAVQEFTVDTQNFKAEYEQAGSAIITAVTKTGGNEFHGDLFGELQPKAFFRPALFRSAGQGQQSRTARMPKPDYDRKQYGGDLGGPIIKDVLHFYCAFEGHDQKVPSAIGQPQSGADVRRAEHRSPASTTAAIAQTFKQELYFGKLTLFASGADTINLSLLPPREQASTDYRRHPRPSHGHLIDTKIDTLPARMEASRGNFLNEMHDRLQQAFNGTPRAT